MNSSRKILASLVGLVFLLGSGCSVGAAAPDWWVKEQIRDGDILLCAEESGGDLYFVALSGKRIKTSYRVDVSSDHGVPKVIVIIWEFKDGDGRHIGLAGEPEVVKQRYARSGGRVYAEEVAYREVMLKSVRRINVTIALRKYVSAQDASIRPLEREGELERVVSCERTIAASEEGVGE